MMSPAVGVILLVGFLGGGIFAAIALARTTLLGRQLRDYTQRIRKLEENFVESRMKLNVLAAKANWEPPEWEPPKIEELARQLVKEVDNFKPRCSHCNFIIVDKPKHSHNAVNSSTSSRHPSCPAYCQPTYRKLNYRACEGERLFYMLCWNGSAWNAMCMATVIQKNGSWKICRDASRSSMS